MNYGSWIRLPTCAPWNRQRPASAQLRGVSLASWPKNQKSLLAMTYSPGGLPPQYHRRGRSLRPGSGCGRVYPRRCGHQETFSLWMDDTQSTVGSCQQKPVLRTTQSPRSLVRVGCAPCSASTSRLSSRWSSCDLTSLRSEGSHLEASFPLRCFQRLSLPDVATQRCRWHDNWHTSGLSTPVLSY